MKNQNPQQPSDIAQREQALNINKSFCVTAPAGSGKTELLTRRVLKLLAHCNEPEEILCITFTRKAAAEMKARILETLEKGKRNIEAENDYEKSQWLLARAACLRNNERNWQIFKNPGRLKIQTIDSFCHGLTRQLPLLSGIGASVNICENPDHYYLEASRKFISSIESNEPYSEPLITVLEHMDNNIGKVEQLFVTMLKKRDQWLPLTDASVPPDQIRTLLENWLQELINEQLTKVRSLLEKHERSLVNLANYAAGNLSVRETNSNPGNPPVLYCLDMKNLPKADFENLKQWFGIQDLLLTKEGNFRKAVSKRNGFYSDGKGDEKKLQKEKKQALKDLIDSLNEEIEENLSLLSTLPSPHYDDEQWEVLDALSTSLKYLAAHLQLVFQEHGEVDHTEVMAASLRALGEEDKPTDLALILDQKINHILIDEFQDTSILQFHLAKQLTATWAPDDGRSLFVVGDGMQSIYKFRNANVGLFLKAKQSGIGDLPLTPLDLKVNFRSREKIINWVNHIFSRAFPQQENISLGAMCYSDSESFSKEDTNQEQNSVVNSFIFTGENSRHQEALQVRKLVLQSLDNNPDGSIAILVRSRSHLNEILPVLSESGIPWQANELDSLNTNQTIQDLLTLTRALYSLTDRIAWLALLRSPFCGLSLEDLHTLATASQLTGKSPSLWQSIMSFEQAKALSEDGKARLDKIRKILNGSLKNKLRKPARSWIEGTWHALGGPIVANDSELNDVDAFFDLLEQTEDKGLIDLSLLSERIDQLYARPNTNVSTKVQIMTMHKSKGLEFDTVILPGLARRPRNEDTPLLRWYERINEKGEERLLMAPIAGIGKNRDDIFDYIQYEEKRKSSLEATRLLYVACTRAKNNLYLTACLEEENNNEQDTENPEENKIKTPINSSLLINIWPELEKQCQINTPVDDLNFKSNNLDTHSGKLNYPVRISSRWQLPHLPQGTLLEKYRGKEYPQDKENNPVFNLNTLDKHIGTVTHEALYSISQVSLEERELKWNINQLEQYSILWQNRLKQLGSDNQSASQGSEKILSLIKSTLQCKTGQWILNPNHLQAASELPISVYGQGESKEYVIDRTFIDEKGIRWIIDYKTGAPSKDLETDIFLELEKEKYRPQLLRYKEAFEKMEERPLVMALYFPALNVMVEL